MASSFEGLSPYVPLYKVVEDNDTAFFLWDPAKASAHGNSFQKKIMLLFGDGDAAAVEVEQLRASALAALISAFKDHRAAAVAALSSVLTAETKKYPDVSPACPSRSPPAEASGRASLKSGDSAETEDCKKVLEVKETETSEPIIESNGGESGSKTDADQDENASETSQSTFSYERLKAKSDDPVMGIDYSGERLIFLTENSNPCLK